MKFDDRGREIPDPRPVAIPHNWQRPLSLHEEIKRFVRSELSAAADRAQAETFEEADDFEVEDDQGELFVSPFEIPEAFVEAPGGVKDVDPDPPPPPGEKAPVAAPSEPEGQK